MATGGSDDAWANAVHPEDRERAVKQYTKLVNDLAEGIIDEHNEFEFRWLTKENGEEQWCFGSSFSLPSWNCYS
jgi:hypothetical protein